MLGKGAVAGDVVVDTTIGVCSGSGSGLVDAGIDLSHDARVKVLLQVRLSLV